MKILSGSALVIAALVTMMSVAEAATAGHMLRSATPATNASDQAVTGAIKGPGEEAGDITGSIRKPHGKRPNDAGAVNSKSNVSH